MMCYFLRIGTWKEHDPTDIIDKKRGIDKIAHIYAPLFSPDFMKCYNGFMEKCFSTFRGAGLDAQLRSECEHYRDAYVGDENDDGTWRDEWDECFTGTEGASDRGEVRQAYVDLVGTIARELGVGLEMKTAVTPETQQAVQ